MGLFHGYRPILNNDSENGQVRVERGPNRLRILGLFLLTLTLCAVSFAAGQHRPPPKIPLSTNPFVFEYDPSFQDQQSPLIDEKWRGLFPKREGFFSHPTIAPQRSALAVFHQLHCLNSIRKGYWALYDIAASDQPFPGDENFPEMSAPAHMQHCIELLRNALMCQPDLTIERKIDGGVTGFGTEHECKSWDDLVQWAGKWESYGLNDSDSESSHM